MNTGMTILNPGRPSEVLISQGGPSQESAAPPRTTRSQGQALLNQSMVTRAQSKRKQPMALPNQKVQRPARKQAPKNATTALASKSNDPGNVTTHQSEQPATTVAPITRSSAGDNTNKHQGPSKRMSPPKAKPVEKETRSMDVPRVPVRKSARIMNNMKSCPSNKGSDQVVNID
ncbi:uncharacterized protein LOC115672387 [Syzygium oleosum]|uniref:uncharacterized protein LOC115672387 n=1 Tax=Syzygium oleosum TaxID=219896 RepID=UPI0024B89C9A|nr:uncharacterized protein LOC115672387 [Syzygium oleosum]